MKWFEVIFLKISIIYIITFISFWKFKIIWTKKKVEYYYSITFQWPFFWIFFLINGYFFVNIMILPMLSYFQLLYDYFSLI
jgi:hypothetical protein